VARGIAALLVVLGVLVASLARSRARADDWSLERGTAPRAAPSARPRRPAIPEPAGASLARHFELALARPEDEAAFERLSALYRERDGGLARLGAELDARVASIPAGAALTLRARVHELAGELDAARAAFERAAQLSPALRAPIVLAARLERRAGALERAQALLTRASELSKTGAPVDREAVVEELAEVALERKDFDAAASAFESLAVARKDSPFAATAFARALAAHGEHVRAAIEYRRQLARLHGDVRVTAPLELEQARSEIEAGELDAALQTLERVLRATRAAPGLRAAADELRLQLHRRAGSLAALAASLDARSAGSFEEAELLARVHEELGDQPAAEKALRRALALRPRDVDARERLVRMLTREGRLGEAIGEHHKLVDAAPGEPRHVTSLAQSLFESGLRQEALQLLQRTSERFAGDARVARALLDIYARWGEHDRARELLQRLARLEPGDPSHLFALGQEQLDRGDEAASKATFARALERAVDRDAAHATLADLYLDRDRPAHALEHYERAVRAQPDNVAYLRGLAETLERLKRPAEAEARFREVMAHAGRDAAARREARRRIVLLWAGSGELRGKVRELEASTGLGEAERQAPAGAVDLEPLRFLAEAYRTLTTASRHARSDARLSRATDVVLTRILEIAPGDVEALTTLERARSERHDLDGASEILERLIEADPPNAAGYLARLAQNALSGYRDDQALQYAERLVALAPNDAASHTRLAELYTARQDTKRAIASYERAIDLDARAYPSMLALAELHLGGPAPLRADGLLRRVVAGSADDEHVHRAARALMQMHLGAGTLRSLEPDFIALAMRAAQRPVHRQLLVELYAALAQPLLELRARGAEHAVRARDELRALGKRAVQPLLEALMARDAGARTIAVELLGAMDNAVALLPLLAAAEREGDVAFRRGALIAAGTVAHDGVLDRLSELARGDEIRLRDAAAWAIARNAGPRAASILLDLSQSETPAVRGYAWLGLARAGGASTLAEASIERAIVALEHDRNPWARGSAALLLGLGARPRGQRAQTVQVALLAALQVDVDEVAAAAALALGRLRSTDALAALCARVFEGGELSSRAAAWALQAAALDDAALRTSTLEIPPPSDRVALADVIASEIERNAVPDTALAPSARRELGAALRVALGGALPTLRNALRVLHAGEAERAGWTHAWTDALVADNADSLGALAQHGDAQVRTLALALLARLPAELSAPTYTAALASPQLAVRRSALDALVKAGPRSTAPLASLLAEELARLARTDAHWWVRAQSIAALGGHQDGRASRALIDALLQDSSAYVRQAAARALGSRRHLAAPEEAAALQKAASTDSEVLVRSQAGAALESQR
jgi:tetratricopeptide (TPR) repeat protein